MLCARARSLASLNEVHISVLFFFNRSACLILKKIKTSPSCLEHKRKHRWEPLEFFHSLYLVASTPLHVSQGESLTPPPSHLLSANGKPKPPLSPGESQPVAHTLWSHTHVTELHLHGVSFIRGLPVLLSFSLGGEVLMARKQLFNPQSIISVSIKTK